MMDDLLDPIGSCTLAAAGERGPGTSAVLETQLQTHSYWQHHGGSLTVPGSCLHLGTAHE